MDSKFEREPDDRVGEEEEEDAPLEVDVGLEDGALSDEDKKLLEEFPEWKKQQEKLIEILRALAKNADEIYKKYTKKKLLTKFVTVTSELVSIAGLALAPATAGTSLSLTTLGQIVSATAAVTDIATELSENSHYSRLRARANRQVPNPDQEFEDTGGRQISYFTAAGQAVYKCGRAWEVISKRIRALVPTKIPASLGAKSLTRSIQPVYGGPMAAVSLGEDVYALWNNWKKLRDEAKAELAKDLRAWAQVLEEQLVQTTQRYNTLKKKEELRAKRMRK